MNDDGVSAKGEDAFICDWESACRVAGEDDTHAVPQKGEHLVDLALGRRGRWEVVLVGDQDDSA